MYSTGSLDDLLSRPDVVSIFQKERIGFPTRINLDDLYPSSDVYGRYVRVQLQHENSLGLAEVEVMGERVLSD